MAKRKMPYDDKPKTIVEEPVTTEDITEVAEEIIEEPVKARIGKVFKCDKLNVRKEPSFSSTILGTLTHGDEVKILDEANENFFKISYKTGEAYVASEFIK